MSDKIATRNAYGQTLAELGASDPAIVALDADVSTCTMSCFFGQKFPERFFNVGIAEENMVGMAAGMATLGLKPYVHAFAIFATGRCYDQVRNSVAYPGLNVKVVGTHAGLSVGEDGATHQALEDIALMRAIPGMVVVCPADGHEAARAVHALNAHSGPAYLRLGRLAVPTVTDFPGYSFELGKTALMRQGTDATIIATGLMVHMSLTAADELAKEGVSVRVLNMHTIKPIDRDAIIAAARETGLIVTAEEHNVMGGLGSAVAEVVTENCPVHVLKVGVQDTFGTSGSPAQVLEKYGLNPETIAWTVKKGVTAKAKAFC